MDNESISPGWFRQFLKALYDAGVERDVVRTAMDKATQVAIDEGQIVITCENENQA